MKNLIITMGILSLMTMGILYETDSLHLIIRQRQISWICAEMAEAASYAFGEGKSQEEAEQAAEEILRRNTGEETAEKIVWNLEKEGNTVTVKVTAPPPDFALAFLDDSICLSACSEKAVLSES